VQSSETSLAKSVAGSGLKIEMDQRAGTGVGVDTESHYEAERGAEAE
jgi:hypothetical protein